MGRDSYLIVLSEARRPSSPEPGRNNADSFAVYVLTFVKSFLSVSVRFPLSANERFTNEIGAVN